MRGEPLEQSVQDAKKELLMLGIKKGTRQGDIKTHHFVLLKKKVRSCFPDFLVFRPAKPPIIPAPRCASPASLPTNSVNC